MEGTAYRTKECHECCLHRLAFILKILCAVLPPRFNVSDFLLKLGFLRGSIRIVKPKSTKLLTSSYNFIRILLLRFGAIECELLNSIATTSAECFREASTLCAASRGEGILHHCRERVPYDWLYNYYQSPNRKHPYSSTPPFWNIRRGNKHMPYSKNPQTGPETSNEAGDPQNKHNDETNACELQSSPPINLLLHTNPLSESSRNSMNSYFRNYFMESLHYRLGKERSASPVPTTHWSLFRSSRHSRSGCLSTARYPFSSFHYGLSRFVPRTGQLVPKRNWHIHDRRQ